MVFVGLRVRATVKVHQYTTFCTGAGRTNYYISCVQCFLLCIPNSKKINHKAPLFQVQQCKDATSNILLLQRIAFPREIKITSTGTNTINFTFSVQVNHKAHSPCTPQHTNMQTSHEDWIKARWSVCREFVVQSSGKQSVSKWSKLVSEELSKFSFRFRCMKKCK